MGLMRDYMQAGDLRDHMAAGDPFRFRLPKRLFKPPKALRKLKLRSLAPLLSFVPGVGGLAAGLAAAGGGGGGAPGMYPEGGEFSEPPPLEEETPVYPPELVQYARSFGIELGDPGGKGPNRGARPRAGGGKTAPRPKPQAHSTRGTTSARPKPKPHAFGAQHPSSLGDKTKAFVQGLKNLDPRNPASFLDLAIGSTKAGRGGAAGGGGRRMNVLNPHALSKAVSRLAGFQRRTDTVEKRMMKIARKALRGHHHTASSSSRRGKKC